MLLVIDTGNTNTLFAIHDGDKWLVEWRIATDASRTADEYAVWFYQLMSMQKIQINDINACVISSVVPQSLFNMRNLSRRHLNVEPIVVGDEGIDIGVAIDIDNPKEVGSDRLVTALGALQKYEGNLLIVDSGTATTFDIISKDKLFEGGIIAPGIRLSLDTLSDKATLIPKINLKMIKNVIGNDTVSAVRSGFFWGYAGLIDNIIKLIKKE